MTKTIKVAVSGAAGQISYSLLFRIASGEVFGHDTKVDLHLLELPRGLAALEGVAMELTDGAFSCLNRIVYTDQTDIAMDGIDWALLVGASPRKAGMERSDLLEANAGTFTVQGDAINRKAGSDVKVLVVGNPCNTNAWITMKSAPDVPNERFFAMTMLDELRAKGQLAEKAQVPVSEVSQMAIWGNHSATQYPDYQNALIGGQGVAHHINDEAWFLKTFIPTVQQRGAAVIQARGASSAASAANAAIETVKCIHHKDYRSDWFSVAKVSKGEYGVEPGLIFSFPCQHKGGEIQVVEGIDHDEAAEALIKLSHDELTQERDTVIDMGLVSDD